MGIRSYNYGKLKNNSPNTFIGGIALQVSTASALATKLGIAVSNIKSFQINSNGLDISCRININYNLGNGFSNNGSLITYFLDFDGRVTSLANSFYSCFSLKYVYLPKVTSIGEFCFYHENQRTDYETMYPIKALYLPSLIYLGKNVTNNEGVFKSTTRPTNLYTNDYLRTVNAGNPDNDIVSGAAIGVTTTYILDFTKPNSITNLSAGDIYNSAIQLNFAIPLSVNTLSDYEVWVNGAYYTHIPGSGSYIYGLTANTNYNIEIYSTDIYYNRSYVSNTLSVSTNSTSTISTNGLISYYRFNESSGNILFDNYGTNNGIYSGCTLGVAGIKGGTSAFLNGTTDYIDLGNPSAFQLNTGAIVFWVKSTNVLNNPRTLISKNGAYTIKLVYGNIGTQQTATGYWNLIAINFAPGTNNSRIYVNEYVASVFTNTVSTQANKLIIASSSTGYNGSIDEMAIYNRNLTLQEIKLIFNNKKGSEL
ncbi:LamG domain-containing protein [Flavobacterium sp. ASV13]|uniref:LamG domain-containing protein n=1 Tax=Flavobacterium sp. ASV13 TaxID=1506583 RepID=UPI00054FDA15|nr:LamG domain-containing protein [Flavobacterium sp. ASV13]